MDVRKKFTLSMIGLAVLVIFLGILVYLSATQTSFEEKEDLSTFNPETSDPEILFRDDEQKEEQIAEEKQFFQEETNVIATITLEDTQTPEIQLKETEEISIPDDEAIYTLRMNSGWNNQLHPNFHPDGSHLSPMVIWSHRLKNTVFKENTTASEGMEIMAETGATKKLVQEIQNYTITGSIFNHSADDGGPLFTPGERTIQIKASKNAPYVTVVSMIAPSPDWFITARNIQMYENGRWLERISIPARLYDAGTDSGTTFIAPDEDTNPKQLITKLRNAPAIPIATFEFVRN